MPFLSTHQERTVKIETLPKELLARRHITETGCWHWTGSLSGAGYGYISYLGVRWLVHRLAWASQNGPIPQGRVVRHKCDNPCCFNPDHLTIGTQGDNIRDAFERGRAWQQQPTEEFLSKPSEPVSGRPLLLGDLFDKFEKEYIPDLEPRTQRDYKGILVKLRQEFGHFEPKALKPRQVVAFLDVKKGRVHRNRMVAILSSVYRKAIGKWCVDDDLVNPCSAVERWPTRPRNRYVTDDEFASIRTLACAQVQIAMDLALLTGQRQGDIVGLTWKQIKTIGVKREDWRIEIDQGKTGKKLAIMISPAIEQVLRRARVMAPQWPHEYVIRTKWGKRYTPDGFRALWQRTIRKWKSVTGSADVPHFHDIRAKSISDNESLDDAYLLAGHIDIKMTRRVYDRNRRRVQPLR
jgi:integrase